MDRTIECHGGVARIAPDDVHNTNPAFGITPNRHITAIVTEPGVVHPPLKEGFARVFSTS